MKLALMALGAALTLLAPSAAAAVDEAGHGVLPRAQARVVEIRVSGDAAALERVKLTGAELLQRLDVQAVVKAQEDPPTPPSDTPPLVIAYVDFHDVGAPSIRIEDGQSHEQLSKRTLSDVSSLETGAEAVLHILYLTVESMLQFEAAPPPAPVAAPLPSKPQPPPAPAKPVEEQSHFGFDVGPVLHLTSLGGSRILPGGGVALEPRADFGRMQASLLVLGALHGSTVVSYERGEAEVRPLQLRIVPTIDWLLSSDVSGSWGLGAGIDSFRVSALQVPDAGRVLGEQSVTDPVMTAQLGARTKLSGRAFLAAIAALDLDLAPTVFVAHSGPSSVPLLALPRLRGGFTLALSFTAAGEHRFEKGNREP